MPVPFKLPSWEFDFGLPSGRPAHDAPWRDLPGRGSQRQPTWEVQPLYSTSFVLHCVLCTTCDFPAVLADAYGLAASAAMLMFVCKASGKNRLRGASRTPATLVVRHFAATIFDLAARKGAPMPTKTPRLECNRKPRHLKSHRTRNSTRCLSVEWMENRRLLAVDLSLVRDINAVSSTEGSTPYSIIDVNGTTFFSASTITSGYELWKSDGTLSGTVLVKDINAGSLNAYPLDLTNVNGTLFFSAAGANGSELWKSDGTSAGTVLVKDIRAGSSSGLPPLLRVLVNVNGTLFFTADDGVTGYELWKSDGTAAGTVLVKDIRAGLRRRLHPISFDRCERHAVLQCQ